MELRTVRKIKEASFFLKELKTNTNDAKFVYFLSAYISAARSVLWTMRSEFQRIPGWQQWYDERKTSPAENEFLRKIAEIRNDLVKKALDGLFVTKMECTVTEKDTAKVERMFERLTSGGRIVSDDEIIDLSNSLPITIDRLFFVHKSFPDDDFLDVCDKYMAWLIDHMSSCLAAFGVEALLFSYFDRNPEAFKMRFGCQSLSDLCPSCLRFAINEINGEAFNESFMSEYINKVNRLEETN